VGVPQGDNGSLLNDIKLLISDKEFDLACFISYNTLSKDGCSAIVSLLFFEDVDRVDSQVDIDSLSWLDILYLDEGRFLQWLR